MSFFNFIKPFRLLKEVLQPSDYLEIEEQEKQRELEDQELLEKQDRGKL